MCSSGCSFDRTIGRQSHERGFEWRNDLEVLDDELGGGVRQTEDDVLLIKISYGRGWDSEVATRHTQIQ